jgi:hypothetical protein
MTCNTFCNLCMITKLMNKWIFTFYKCNCHPFTLYLPYASLHHTVLDLCKYLMMQSSLWQMVCTRACEDAILYIPVGSAGRGHGQAPRGNAPAPPPRAPVSLEQLLAMQNDLMRLIVENETRHVAERPQPRHRDQNSSYSDFLASHPPVFADATDHLEADNWLRTTESKFGVLHCIEF